MTDTQLVVQPDTQMAVIRDTSIVLTEAKQAAQSLQSVIKQKHRPVMFNGEQYLELEDWLLAGQFYGYTIKTGEAMPVEIDGIKGAKAHAQLIDKEGRVMGGAEAFCMRDEPNWRSKPWFQLASMAQTRAGSKALKNRLAWFVVMAGFKPTPAEEMDSALPAETRKSDEIPLTMEMNRFIKEISEMLAAVTAGDTAEMDAQLKALTTWKDKETRAEKWLTLKDLPSVAMRKPDWMRGIHKKVAAVYDAKFGETPQN